MAIDKVGAVGSAAAAGGIEAPKEKFSEALQQVGKGGQPQPFAPQQPQAVNRIETDSLQVSAPGSPGAAQLARSVERVSEAQEKLDQILQLAESGKSFTPAELLAMQAHVYRASQEIDLASKVVDKATSGVKQVLQTNV